MMVSGPAVLLLAARCLSAPLAFLITPAVATPTSSRGRSATDVRCKAFCLTLLLVVNLLLATLLCYHLPVAISS